MRRKGLARSAPYGQACLSCVRAKCRCVPRRGAEGGCERCHRLQRQCQPSEPHRPRDDAAQVALLEDRLESLTALLDSRRLLDRGNVGSNSAEASDFIDLLAEASTTVSSLEPVAANTTAVTTPIFNTHPNASPISTASEPPKLSATHLDHFCSYMLPNFPFARLPTGSTAEQLHRDRPLFSQAIVVVTLPFSQQRQTSADELKRTLCEAAFLRPRHCHGSSGGIDLTVDLLLGLMTYIAWGWDFVNTRRSLSSLVTLCMSLVGELNLDKPAPIDLHTSNLLATNSQGRQTQRHISPEQRCASLGCFVLSSAVSAFFADMEPPKWSSQLQESLSIISRNKESRKLAVQVRLQLLSAKALKLRDSLQKSNQEQSAVAAATVTTEAETLLARLQELRSGPEWAPHSNQKDLRSHASFVELNILETIRLSSFIASQSSDSSVHSGVGLTDPGQSSSGYSDLSYMWQSVLALGACTSGLLSLNPSELTRISFLQWDQLASCVVILSHLECLEDSRINRPSARAVVDLPVLLDQISSKLSLAAVETRDQRPENVFAQLSNSMQILRSNIQSPEVELSRPGPNDVSGCGPNNAVGPQQGYFQNARFWMDRLFTS